MLIAYLSIVRVTMRVGLGNRTPEAPALDAAPCLLDHTHSSQSAAVNSITHFVQAGCH